MTVAVMAPSKNISILVFTSAGFCVIKSAKVATHKLSVGFAIVTELLCVAADVNVICNVVILRFVNFVSHSYVPSYVVKACDEQSPNGLQSRRCT
jgi:hypothetical protein